MHRYLPLGTLLSFFALAVPSVHGQSAQVSAIGRSKIPQTLHKSLVGTPKLGTTLKFQLPTTNFFPFWESYFLMLGDSKTRHGALALPFPFRANINNVSPTLAFDIVLYCSWMVVIAPGRPSFQQVFSVPIPNDRRLLGTRFYVQALNRFGSGDPYSQVPKPSERWRSTEALELTIGT